MSCIVTLKAQCSMRAASYFLPETITGRFEEEQGRKYPTALPLLIQLFANDSLNDIKGYTQYVDAPNLQLPKFQFYETSLTKTLSRDEKQKVNLEKAVQSVKNDKIIVNGLSEAIVLGKVSTYVNFWITTPGIVTIITTIVGILSILANLYLLNKIRYLLIVRLAVSVSEVSVSEPIPWYRYRYRFHPVSVPIPVTVVIILVISFFIIITVQHAIVITLLSVNIVRDVNRVCCFVFLSV